MEPTSPHLNEQQAADSPQRLPPPPRLVRRRPGRHGLLGHVPLAVWLLCLAGAGLLVLAVWLVVRPWLITQFGMTVSGEVTGKSPLSERARAGVVQFRYYVQEQKHEGEDTVAGEAFDRLHPGSPVKVRVLPAWPDDPVLVEPASRAGRGSGVLLVLALLGNLALAILVRAYLREPLRQRALVREGVATGGVIVSKEAGSGRRTSWAVQYTYRAPRYGLPHGGDGDGRAVAEKEWQVRMAVSQEDHEAAQVGAAMTVLYDPRQPSRSLVYDFATYEAVSPSTEQPHLEPPFKPGTT
jgi:hypothetical protein